LAELPVAVCRALKIIWGVLCLGVGVAFAIGVAELFGEPELGAPAAALFLLGSFFVVTSDLKFCPTGRREGRSPPTVQRLQLHALACDLGNFLRRLATPENLQQYPGTNCHKKKQTIG
jgi:hypothetical protein